MEHDRKVRSFHVPDVTSNTLQPIIGRYISAKSNFMSDESPVYKGIGWNFESHRTVKHSDDEYVRGDAHINTVEGYFSILKRGIYGCYFHVSEARPKRYLAEFDFRYNFRIKLGFDDVARGDIALRGVKGKRLTYRTPCRVGAA